MTPENPQVMLELQDVSLSFRSSKGSFDDGVHHVLDGVSFKLYENETLGIVGRNGVGKTTMLRIMAGILAPTSGTVITRPDVAASLLTIGLGHRLDLNGRDNALLSAMLQGASKSEALGYLEEIKAFSELGDSFEEPVKTYSAGMKSRLGFTTALLTHVDILLVDEILSVGDAEFRQKAEQAMKQRISGNQTVVFVSHSNAQVKELCDRVLWIDKGKIRAEGDPEDTLAQYRASMKK
ncbi:ABC transporter ATP-binding protein [Pseudohalioglobus lutimaris]|nr:ABC transporter ATP-binding protein [Pseudohalioglobus lutimaris]